MDKMDMRQGQGRQAERSLFTRLGEKLGGSPLSREVNFPGKSSLLGSQFSQEVNFPRKSTFPGTWEVNFSGKSLFQVNRFSQTTMAQ